LVLKEGEWQVEVREKLIWELRVEEVGWLAGGEGKERRGNDSRIEIGGETEGRAGAGAAVAVAVAVASERGCGIGIGTEVGTEIGIEIGTEIGTDIETEG
jgi:hypothetical protein